jgi:acyl-CoA synthetase (AMP-forming)/AMP-acid ligase II
VEQVFIRSGCYNQDVASFFTKWMVDLMDTQKGAGTFGNQAPVFHGHGSPAWADAGVFVTYVLGSYRLYVTGRKKDMIIIVGKNYYPHDIESDLEPKIPEISVQGAIAFAHSVEGKVKESIVIVVELARRHIESNNTQAIRDKIRSTVSESFDLRVDTIAFTPVGSIPKATSGKKQRILFRELYRKNQIRQLDE